MHGRPGVGKKRKYEVDLDAERTLYTGFVAAANSVSQLYTQAVQQQRRASAAASRQALVSPSPSPGPPGFPGLPEPSYTHRVVLACDVAVACRIPPLPPAPS